LGGEVRVIIQDGQFSYRDPAGRVHDGDTIVTGNYCQAAPGTEILRDVKDLTILGGNWVNVRAQPSWAIKGGNWMQVERCTNLHPELIALGVKACAKDCQHAVAALPQTDPVVLKAEAKAQIDLGQYQEAQATILKLTQPVERYADRLIPRAEASPEDKATT